MKTAEQKKIELKNAINKSIDFNKTITKKATAGRTTAAEKTENNTEKVKHYFPFKTVNEWLTADPEKQLKPIDTLLYKYGRKQKMESSRRFLTITQTGKIIPTEYKIEEHNDYRQECYISMLLECTAMIEKYKNIECSVLFMPVLIKAMTKGIYRQFASMNHCFTELEEQADGTIKTIYHYELLSLDTTPEEIEKNLENEETTIRDLLIDCYANTENKAINNDHIDYVFAGMNEKTRKIAEKYGQGYTFDEIATMFQVKKSAINMALKRYGKKLIDEQKAAQEKVEIEKEYRQYISSENKKANSMIIELEKEMDPLPAGITYGSRKEYNKLKHKHFRNMKHIIATEHKPTIQEYETKKYIKKTIGYWDQLLNGNTKAIEPEKPEHWKKKTDSSATDNKKAYAPKTTRTKYAYKNEILENRKNRIIAEKYKKARIDNYNKINSLIAKINEK